MRYLDIPVRYLCHFSTHCLSAPNSLFIACAAKTMMGPLNIFPLPADKMLSFSVEIAGENLKEEFAFFPDSSMSCSRLLQCRWLLWQPAIHEFSPKLCYCSAWWSAAPSSKSASSLGTPLRWNCSGRPPGSTSPLTAFFFFFFKQGKFPASSPYMAPQRLLCHSVTHIPHPLQQSLALSLEELQDSSVIILAQT